MDKNVYWICPSCKSRVLQWPDEVDVDSEFVVETHEFFAHKIGDQPKIPGWD